MIAYDGRGLKDQELVSEFFSKAQEEVIADRLIIRIKQRYCDFLRGPFAGEGLRCGRIMPVENADLSCISMKRKPASQRREVNWVAAAKPGCPIAQLLRVEPFQS